MMERQLRSVYTQLSRAELLDLAFNYDHLAEDLQREVRAEFERRGMEPPELDPHLGEELVTVRRYRDLSEGIVARSLLESADIRAELRDENLIRLDWQISNFIGGLRLQVPAADVTVALEMLEGAVIDPMPLENGWEFTQPACPACVSREITFRGASRTAAMLGVWILGLPLPSGKETWHCETCGSTWEDGAAR